MARAARGMLSGRLLLLALELQRAKHGLVSLLILGVVAASLVLSDRQDFQLGAGCFFAVLITLIIWLSDVFKPVHDTRHAAAG